LTRLRFDITSLDNVLAEEDEKGILASVHTVNQIITDEISESGITADRLVIGGFSQGGVISLVTGLTNERHLAGIVSLSGFLGIRQKVKAVRIIFHLPFRYLTRFFR
jgi:predicted esterase